MPSPNKPTFLESIKTMCEVSRGTLVRVSCCGRPRHYYPEDLVRLFGNIRVVDIGWHLKRCERCGSREFLRIEFAMPSAEDRSKLLVRRLVTIKTKQIPVWRDE